MYQLASAFPFIVSLVWAVFYLLEFRHATEDRRALAIYGLASSLLFFFYYLHFNSLEMFQTEALHDFCKMLVFPLLAFYIRRLTKGNIRWVNVLPALIPAFVIGIWSKVNPDSRILSNVILWMFPVIVLLSMGYGILTLVRFRKKVDNYYSNPENKRLDSLFYLIVLFFICTIAAILFHFMGKWYYWGDIRLWIPSIVISVLQFLAFYIGDKTELPEQDVRAPAETISGGFSEEQMLAMMEKIEQTMQEKQLFRTKGFTIANLAEEIGSNRTYVSMCINQFSGGSFSEYVNKARIEYAIKLIQENPSLTLNEIADAAGFNDRSTFYRGFMKVTGQTPSAWKAAQQ